MLGAAPDLAAQLRDARAVLTEVIHRLREEKNESCHCNHCEDQRRFIAAAERIATEQT